MALLDESAVSYQAVLTKADKTSAGALRRVVAATRETLAKRPAAHPELWVTSAQTGEGVADLRAVLAALAPPREAG